MSTPWPEPTRRLRVLFVAGIDPVIGGKGTGGQLVVANTLLDSELARHVEFVPLSSTGGIPVPPMTVRTRRAAARLAKFVRAIGDIDVALVFASAGASLLEKGAMVMIARTLGKGVVLRIGSGILEEDCKRSRATRAWLSLVLARTHVVCAQSAHWTRFFQAFTTARSKVIEVPNPVRMPRLRAFTAKARPTVVFVGWMIAAKGIFEALEVFEALRDRGVEAQVIMVGGGADLKAFRDGVRARGLEDFVTTTGWLESSAVREVLATSDVFFLPTHAEGVPNALLEAMGTGLAVVTTRVGGIPDVVEDGVNGVLVAPRDTAAMTDGLARLLRDPTLVERLGRAAHATVEARFSLDRVWPLVLGAIERAAREAGGRRSRGTDARQDGRT